MIKISVEVARGAARYRVAVRAKSIRRALELVEKQSSGREVKVVFPIDPESSFVRETATMAGVVGGKAA